MRLLITESMTRAATRKKANFAQMFEEEYNDIINHFQPEFGEEEYLKYLEAIKAEDTHAGYFSIDKKAR
mgnify:CR=1 FL=1